MTQEGETPSQSAVPVQELPLLIPEGVRYNCQGCGRCCSGWSVGMTEEDFARIKDVDWQSLHPDLAGKELFIDRSAEFKAGLSGHPHYTKPREDGTCPFLIDKLCFIHGHLGEDQKPLTCRIFPYSFVETPSGVYTGVVYNSMAAVQNAGNLLSDQRESLSQYLALTRDYARAIHKTSEETAAKDAAAGDTSTATDPNAAAQSPEAASTAQIPNSTVELTLGVVVSWNEFLEIDKKIMHTIQTRTDLGIFQLLAAIGEIFQKGVQLKRQDKPMAEIQDFDPVFTPTMDMTPGAVDEMTMRSMFYRLFVYPTIRVDEKGLWQLQRRHVLHPKNLVTVIRSLTRYSFTAVNTILLKQSKLPTTGRINLDKALKQKMPPLSSDVEEFFRRWIYLKLFAKAYFGAPAAGFCVISGFNCLTSAFISSILFAKASAMGRKAKEVDIKDLYEAFWRIDRELLTMGQVPKRESIAYNFAFAQPRLFNKFLLTLEKSLQS